MESALIFAIIFGGLVLSLMTIGGTILVGIKILKGGVSQSKRRQNIEETRMIQEMYQALSRMENRVDALETILLDRRKEKGTDDH